MRSALGGRRSPRGIASRPRRRYVRCFNRAVAWKIIDSNPAKAGVDNPRWQHPEKRPFESWTEINAVADHLGAFYGPMVVFAAATGLRPGEWIALEHRDLDRDWFTWSAFAPASRLAEQRRTAASRLASPHRVRIAEALRGSERPAG
jgi:integrase